MNEAKVLKNILKEQEKSIKWLASKSGVSKKLITLTISENRPIWQKHAILLAEALDIDAAIITSPDNEVETFWKKSNDVAYKAHEYRKELNILDGIKKSIKKYSKDSKMDQELSKEYTRYLKRKEKEISKEIAKLENACEIPVNYELSEMEIEELRYLLRNTEDERLKATLNHTICILERYI